MACNYKECFKSMTTENLLSDMFICTGNESLFWLSIELVNRVNNDLISGNITTETLDSYNRACAEIEGLDFIGYLDMKHKKRFIKETGKTVFAYIRH